jgi:hypothetical protein
MPRTALTPQVVKGPYPGTVAANDLDITWAAGDDVNGNEFAFTGRELILVRNDDAAAQTVTLLSSATPGYGRTADITTYSLAAGEYAAFWAGATQGWVQPGSKFNIDLSDPDLKFAVLRF